MSRILPLLFLLGVAHVFFGGCDREPTASRVDYGAIQRLTSENEQLRAQNSELRDLHEQALTEMKSLRRTADRADVALRSSYLSLVPVGGVVVLLGGGLAAVCYLLVRRRRRGGA